MKTVEWMTKLRAVVVARFGDGKTIVRLDVEADTYIGSLKLVILYNGIYQPFDVDDDDFADPDVLIAFCLSELEKNPKVPTGGFFVIGMDSADRAEFGNDLFWAIEAEIFPY